MSLPSGRRSGLFTAVAAALGLVLAVVAAPDSAHSGLAPVAAAPTGQPVADDLLASLSGATGWTNSAPLDAQSLRGKVVLVDFWTYSCINCLRTLPYLRAWAEKYKSAGLVVIGVHSPEFSFEQQPANVQRATQDLHIEFPVAIDSRFAIWHAFGNRFWPAFYLLDGKGRIRHHQFGEEGSADSERAIQQLLAETGRSTMPPGLVTPRGFGVQAAPGAAPPGSPETYLGHERTEGFASPGGLVADRSHEYTGATTLRVNQWALSGMWTAEPERVRLDRPNGRIAYRFHARDLHLVLGPATATGGQPVRFKVSIDGQPPQADHGFDVDPQGNGMIDAQRLYQLVRQTTSTRDRLFEIEFLDAGAQAYAFTFG